MFLLDEDNKISLHILFMVTEKLKFQIMLTERVNIRRFE